MAVDRCICSGRLFSDLKTIADQNGSDFELLSGLTGCGNGCGLCAPYVKLMLKTGRVRFPVMSDQQLARALAEGGAGATAES